ncbi:hypothetical protein FVQ98_13565 [Ottowia sp. GY511]|uniref:Uncharacterized protein n=1 Tax=Ottowia flava TaxID=2675430 RepID=A0ABW4KWK9_9BURK|nr:hypothetical protein [Ottowia sp. GY511]TXK26652.1 hypothetical protein FVQ98_13565 [Ottowia sp. GY511]
MAAIMLSPTAAFSRTMKDLKLLRIPGVQAFTYRDESTLPLNQATTQLADAFRARGAGQSVDGETLAADATTSDDAIARSVDAALGKEWKRSTGFTSANPHIHLMVWERTTAPRRFYAIAAFDAVHTATADGRKYRPLESVFTRER